MQEHQLQRGLGDPGRAGGAPQVFFHLQGAEKGPCQGPRQPETAAERRLAEQLKRAARPLPRGSKIAARPKNHTVRARGSTKQQEMRLRSCPAMLLGSMSICECYSSKCVSTAAKGGRFVSPTEGNCAAQGMLTGGCEDLLINAGLFCACLQVLCCPEAGSNMRQLKSSVCGQLARGQMLHVGMLAHHARRQCHIDAGTLDLQLLLSRAGCWWATSGSLHR